MANLRPGMFVRLHFQGFESCSCVFEVLRETTSRSVRLVQPGLLEGWVVDTSRCCDEHASLRDIEDISFGSEHLIVDELAAVLQERFDG